jgi:hypothetical protein
MKQLFRRRRATRAFPGEFQAQPIHRVGALVFQPDNTKKIILGQPQGCDPDSRMCVGSSSTLTRWKNVFPQKVAEGSEKKESISLKQLSGGQDMAPVKAVKVLLATCPRALLRSTLTALTSAMTRRLGIASNKSALEKKT